MFKYQQMDLLAGNLNHRSAQALFQRHSSASPTPRAMASEWVDLDSLQLYIMQLRVNYYAKQNAYTSKREKFIPPVKYYQCGN